MDECDSKCLNYFHKNRDLSPKKINSAVYPFPARCFYTLYSLYVLYIHIYRSTAMEVHNCRYSLMSAVNVPVNVLYFIVFLSYINTNAL